MPVIRSDADYAIRALVGLARDTRSVSCVALAHRCGLPRSLTHKILRKMVKAGIVRSRTGRAGGFSLAKAPEDISLLEVIQAVQGTIVVRPCVVDPEACPLSSTCALSVEWRRIQAGIDEFFGQRSLADVLEGRRADSSGRQDD